MPAVLGDLVGHLAHARNSGELPFNEPPFERLLAMKTLRPDAQFYAIINKAHHDLRNVTPHDASVVDDAFDEADRMLRSCSAAYARFMGRLTREDEELFFAATPSLPAATHLADKQIPILGSLSARTDSDSLATEVVSEMFSFSRLGEVALFAIRSASLGTLALPGQIAIVSLTRQPEANDPVIVLYGNKALARRYHPDQADQSRVTFACDLSGSERVAPALTLSRNKVRTMPIVGVLYDSVVRLGSDEAQHVASSRILDRPLVAARISDDSGYPVIRSGDVVLLEAMDVPSQARLSQMSGEMIALVAAQGGEHFAYLKRVGEVVYGDLRLFESVGARGDSLAIVTAGSALDTGSELLTMQRLWHVHGVLRMGS